MTEVQKITWFRNATLIVALWTFMVIVVGAYVRLSHAGLGCPDWPGCYGHIDVPQAHQEIQIANQTYPERPVETEKAWKEMAHRYIATALGLWIVALAFFSLKVKQAPKVLPWVLVALVCFQGVLGMWTVTWQLKPLAVTGHLLGGMTTFSLLLWQWWSLQSIEKVVRPQKLRILATLALLFLIFQIYLGGWTSTNYAALACPDLPQCQGQWLPQTNVSEAFKLWRGLEQNYEGGVLNNDARVTIHFFHRIGAILLSLVIVFLLHYLFTQSHHRIWKRLGAAVLSAWILQITIGISVVHFQLPLWLADAHNAGAALLLAAIISLNYFAWAGSRRV
jgi:cytochrome c oxidase assembly protein subunit 15